MEKKYFRKKMITHLIVECVYMCILLLYGLHKFAYTICLGILVTAGLILLRESESNYEIEKNCSNIIVGSVDVEQIASDETISVPKQRGGYVLNSIRGTVSGVLTTENPFDFYAFTKNTEFQGNIKFNTSEPNYTLTLGLLDYNTNQISLFSDIVLHPGNNFNINFVPLEEHLDYAWVVQSAGAYGASYSMTYDNDYDPTAFYIAPNGDKYSVRNQKMYLNNSMVSTDYRYDVSFSNQYGYQERHIWVDGANVRPIHVGAVEWYASKQRQNNTVCQWLVSKLDTIYW